MILKWGHCSNELPTIQFLLLNIALGIGHFIILLSAGAYLPMLPYIAGSVGEGIPYTVWGQSNYFTAMGAAFLIARPLMRRFGPRDIAITAYLVFAVSSLMVLLTTQVFPLMTTARTLQGFSAGLSLSPSFYLLLGHYKKTKQHVAIGLWGLAAFTPFSIGPALGGYCAYILGNWRILFLLGGGISLFVASIIWAILEEKDADIDPTFFIRPHLRIFAIFAIACLCLQSFFNVGLLSDLTSRESELWWSGLFIILWFSIFLIVNSNEKGLLIDFNIFKYPNYLISMIILCLGFMALQSSIVQYLIRLQTVEGNTAWHAGLIFLPIFVFSKPLNLLAQYLIHHGYDPRMLASISFFSFAFSFWWMSGFVRPAPWESLIWPMLLEGAAFGLFLISMTSIALGNVPAEKQLHAVDLLNSARNICAGLAITISDLCWDHYISHVRSYLSAPIDLDHDFLTGFLNYSNFSAVAGQQLIHLKIIKQSGLLTINAMFYTLALIFGALGVAIWIASPKHIIHKKIVLDSMVESIGEEP
ncbi:multidrug export protein EmrB [mine drainage metagenome]|uniref:Multidrug export protein EmrB n=1 Tax=mine drainage metagenome TaxID=410659 RepID=A0A1J5S2Z4_9ZZZZ